MDAKRILENAAAMYSARATVAKHKADKFIGAVEILQKNGFSSDVLDVLKSKKSLHDTQLLYNSEVLHDITNALAKLA